MRSYTHIHTTPVLSGLVRGRVMSELEAGQTKKPQAQSGTESKAKQGANANSNEHK